MLITLLLKIEEKFGKKVKVSSDFFNLSIDISRDTNNSISPATLKRIWGYVNDSHVPREFTLDVLNLIRWRGPYCKAYAFSRTRKDGRAIAQSPKLTRTITLVRLRN